MQSLYAVKVIMRWFGWSAVLVLSATAIAQQIPAGTVIPVMLNTGLNAGKDAAGKNIEGKVMQDVPTPLGFTISRGSKVTGQVVSAGKAGGSDPSLVLKFNSIQDHGRTIPLTAAVLAIASMQSVAQAQSPINSNPDMQSASGWVTRQVGGDVVSRSQRKVGTPGGLTGIWLEDSSVIIKLTPNADAGCRRRPWLRSPTGSLDFLQFGLRHLRARQCANCELGSSSASRQCFHKLRPQSSNPRRQRLAADHGRQKVKTA